MAESIYQESISATGLPGATAASRYAGATVSGAPTTGTFATGDFVIDQTGKAWVCTASGTPGTWSQVGGGVSIPNSYRQPSDNAVLAWNNDPIVYNANTVTIGSGTYLFQLQTPQTSVTINNLGVAGGNTGTLLCMAVYSGGPSSYGTLIASASGNVGMGGYSSRVTLSGPVTLNAGSKYWIYFNCNSSSATFLGATNGTYSTIGPNYQGSTTGYLNNRNYIISSNPGQSFPTTLSGLTLNSSLSIPPYYISELWVCAY